MNKDKPRKQKTMFHAPFYQRSYVENMETEDPDYDQLVFHLRDGRVPPVAHGEELATGDYWELAMEPVLDTFEDAGTPRRVASEHTLQQVADLLGCSRCNIRRIEMNALRKLQRFKALRSYLIPLKDPRVSRFRGPTSLPHTAAPRPASKVRIGESCYWVQLSHHQVLRVRLVHRFHNGTMQTAGGFVVSETECFTTYSEAEASLALHITAS